MVWKSSRTVRPRPSSDHGREKRLVVFIAARRWIDRTFLDRRPIGRGEGHKLPRPGATALHRRFSGCSCCSTRLRRACSLFSDRSNSFASELPGVNQRFRRFRAHKLDESAQGCGHMPAAWIIERWAGETLGTRERALRRAARQRWTGRTKSSNVAYQPTPSSAGADGDVRTVRNEKRVGIDLHHLAILLEFPRQDSATQEAMADAGAGEKIFRPFGRTMMSRRDRARRRRNSADGGPIGSAIMSSARLSS